MSVPNTAWTSASSWHRSWVIVWALLASVAASNIVKSEPVFIPDPYWHFSQMLWFAFCLIRMVGHYIDARREDVAV